MKRHTHNSSVVEAEEKFTLNRDIPSSPENLTELGELAIQFLNNKNLEVSKVRPFFWSLVETYVDRFSVYPFDAKKALFNDLELNDYPEETVIELLKQLETGFEKSHGYSLRKSTKLLSKRDSLDAEIKDLRDSLKYAALVPEKSK